MTRVCVQMFRVFVLVVSMLLLSACAALGAPLHAAADVVATSPYSRVLLFEGGSLYLERTLSAHTAEEIPAEETPSALRFMVATAADQAVTPIGDAALPGDLHLSESGDSLVYGGDTLSQQDWSALIGKKVMLRGYGHHANGSMRGTSLRVVRSVRKHPLDRHRWPPEYTDHRCDVCGLTFDKDNERRAAVPTFELRVEETEVQSEPPDVDSTVAPDPHLRWAGSSELLRLPDQPLATRIVLDALIHKAQPLLRDRLRALIARAPKGTVAVGYTHKLESAVELWGEGTYGPAGGRYTLNARFKNTLRAAMPGRGRTEVMQVDERSNAQELSSTAPPCNRNVACDLLTLRRKSRLVYPLAASVAASATSKVQLARDRPVSVYSGPASGGTGSRLMLCDASPGMSNIRTMWKPEPTPSRRSALACLPAPPDSGKCEIVMPPSGYMQSAIVLENKEVQTARAWHLPRLPLQDPPMAVVGSQAQRATVKQLEGATPGCAFFVDAELVCTATHGVASLDASPRAMLSLLGVHVIVPSDASVSLSCSRPLFGCGTAAGDYMRMQDQRVAVGELTAADFEERAKDEAAGKASPALLAQLHNAAVLMRDLEALPLPPRSAQSEVAWNVQRAKRAPLIAALNALLAKSR